MAELEFFDYTFTVSSYEMDMWGCMTPTAVLNICQEVAYMHSSSLGFGFETLIKQDTAWVLSRIKMEAERLPEWREKIRVRTWHKGQSGLFALRDYIFYDSDNQPIMRITSSWLIINIKTRRLQRVDHIFNDSTQVQLMEYHHNALDAEAEKIEISGDQVALSAHSVRYSDIDVNQHVNNAKYMEWACDRSPQQVIQGRRLSHFCINFNHEAKLNEVVEMNGYNPSDDTMIIEGSIGRRSIFSVRLDYVDRPKR